MADLGTEMAYGNQVRDQMRQYRRPDKP